jgi:hypothetical protein
MSFAVSWLVRSAYRYSSLEEIGKTIWSLDRPVFGLWATSVAIGAIIAGIGILLYARSGGKRIWFFGIGVFVVVLIDILAKWRVLPRPGHYSPLFGVGGGLILVFFGLILWLWVKKHVTLEGPARAAAELQLVGYVFFIIAMWYICGALSRPYQIALSDLPVESPVAVIAFLVLGWLFLFLSHYKTAKITQT